MKQIEVIKLTLYSFQRTNESHRIGLPTISILIGVISKGLECIIIALL